MKKVIISILAVLYLYSSTGVTIHLHYCMGELADFDLGSNESKTCGKCGMEKSSEKDNGCCKDEHKFVKNTTDQKIVESSLQFTGFFGVAIFPDHSEIPSIKLSSLTEENLLSHAPLRSKGVAAYILNRTFLI